MDNIGNSRQRKQRRNLSLEDKINIIKSMSVKNWQTIFSVRMERQAFDIVKKFLE